MILSAISPISSPSPTPRFRTSPSIPGVSAPPSATLLIREIPAGIHECRHISPLYKLCELGTLPCSARSHDARVARSSADLAGSLRRRFPRARPTGRPAPVRAGRVERQPSQVDGGDVAAVERLGQLPSAAILHLRGVVECGDRVAPIAGIDSSPRRRVGARRHELSQAGHRVGGGQPPVFGDAGQGRQLPSRRHRGVVDRVAGVARRRAVVSAEILAHHPPADPGAHSRDAPVSRKVAPGVDAAATGARRRHHGHRRSGRRRVRRLHHAASDLASVRPIVCAGPLGERPPRRYASRARGSAFTRSAARVAGGLAPTARGDAGSSRCVS